MSCEYYKNKSGHNYFPGILEAAQLILNMELWTKTFDIILLSVSLKKKNKKSIHISLGPFDSSLLKKSQNMM